MIGMIIILECLIRLVPQQRLRSEKSQKKKTQTTDLCATLWCFIGVVHFFICNETAFNFVSKREEKETTRLFQFCHFCLCIV